jgi:hypothetical protein
MAALGDRRAPDFAGRDICGFLQQAGELLEVDRYVNPELEVAKAKD